MKAGRFFLGFVVGVVAMSAVSFVRTGSDPETPSRSVKISPQGPLVPTRVVSTNETKMFSDNAARREKLTDVPPPVENEAIPAPSENKSSELLARATRLGIPESQAREAMENFGAVKFGVLLEREESKRKALAAPELNADTSSASGLSDQALPEEKATKNPYSELAESLAANPPFRNQEELEAHRVERFNQYVETVKNAEKELFTNNENGLTCNGQNCLPAH